MIFGLVIQTWRQLSKPCHLSHFNHVHSSLIFQDRNHIFFISITRSLWDLTRLLPYLEFDKPFLKIHTQLPGNLSTFTLPRITLKLQRTGLLTLWSMEGNGKLSTVTYFGYEWIKNSTAGPTCKMRCFSRNGWKKFIKWVGIPRQWSLTNLYSVPEEK